MKQAPPATSSSRQGRGNHNLNRRVSSIQLALIVHTSSKPTHVAGSEPMFSTILEPLVAWMDQHSYRGGTNEQHRLLGFREGWEQQT